MKIGTSEDRALRRIDSMRRAFPDATVENYEPLVAAMTNDPKDRHVLAAAVRADAATLVTANEKDFPPRSTAPYDIEVVHPDVFLLDQLDLAPQAVVTSLREQRAALRNPAMDNAEFYQALSIVVPRFAQEARILDASTSSQPDLPLPIEARATEDVHEALFDDAGPDLATPLGAAYLWWTALLDIENCRTALENLTYEPSAWGDYVWARDSLDGWSMAQHTHPHPEAPDYVAMVKLVPNIAASGQAFEDIPLSDVQFLILVHTGNIWLVWGLSTQRVPSLAEMTTNPQ